MVWAMIVSTLISTVQRIVCYKFAVRQLRNNIFGRSSATSEQTPASINDQIAIYRCINENGRSCSFALVESGSFPVDAVYC